MSGASPPGNRNRGAIELVRARMRGAIDVEQVGGIDRGIDLRRGQAGMTEQILKAAQVGAAGQQMCRKAVAQRVRRRPLGQPQRAPRRSEEHTSELQSLMRISYAVFCLKKKNRSRSIIADGTSIRLHK